VSSVLQLGILALSKACMLSNLALLPGPDFTRVCGYAFWFFAGVAFSLGKFSCGSGCSAFVLCLRLCRSRCSYTLCANSCVYVCEFLSWLVWYFIIHKYKSRIIFIYVSISFFTYLCSYAIFLNFMWAYIYRRQPSPFPEGLRAFDCQLLEYAFQSAPPSITAHTLSSWSPTG